jgi:prepilin-type N-terminal cleavage/methylation domain-containing protein
MNAPLQPGPARCAGMTLIEVLLALAILGVGLTILVSTAAKGLTVAKKARYFETARHLLGMVELEAPLDNIDDVLDKGDGGTFERPNQLYRWTREFEIVGPEEDRLFLVRTRIYWAERGQESYEEAVTYLYSPDEEAKDSLTRDTSGSGGGGGGNSSMGGGRSSGGASARVGAGGRGAGSGSSRDMGGSSSRSRLSPRTAGGSSGGAPPSRGISGSSFGGSSSSRGGSSSRGSGSPSRRSQVQGRSN